MGCTIRVTTSDCFYDKWRMARGTYWARAGGGSTKSDIVMSLRGGACPASGERKSIRVGATTTFGGRGEWTVKLLNVGSGYSTIEVWDTSELEPDDNHGFGLGRAEITQTNIGPGLVFNVGSQIDYSVRVMNTGDTDTLFVAIGLGYHTKTGEVYFTGRYAKDEAMVFSDQTFTWNAHIEVLHKDYAAREMTTRGPAVYFMAGHEENGKVVWDRSEYIPVELLLESGYVDPLDPERPPDDWPEPIYEKPDFWGDFWDIVTPEPKEEEEPEKEPIDVLPFIYIGFAGLIGYLLIRGQ